MGFDKTASDGPERDTRYSVGLNIRGEWIELIIRTCRQLAMDNLYDIGQFVRAEGAMARGGEWYTLFFAFQAALTILLSVVWEPEHEQARTWREVLLSTAGWFRNLRSMSKVRDLWVTSSLPRLMI